MPFSDSRRSGFVGGCDCLCKDAYTVCNDKMLWISQANANSNQRFLKQLLQQIPDNTDQYLLHSYMEMMKDGRIWKERVTASVRRRSDLPVMKDGGGVESEAAETKQRSSQSHRMILPSLSAPEHNLLNLLEECNASGL